ncbi:MAG: 4Fe-4S binding protein [Proteobacteria bacterium]|nr:4Fe-4S binding protein [Pseudomonadota bacterium]
MSNKIQKVAIVFFSPQENTRMVAEWFRDIFQEKGIDARTRDLTGLNRNGISEAEIGFLERMDLLLVGSPVYSWHIASPVEWFASRLPRVHNKLAVPFVTYGGVNSGAALAELARSLQKHGYLIAGAGKFLGKHSLMFGGKKPLGRNHPDAGEKALTKKLVDKIISGSFEEEGAADSISWQTLNNKRALVRMLSRTVNMKSLGPMMPKISINPEKCTKCQVCLEACPVRVISINTAPRILTGCIYCYNCVRLCPEGVFEASMAGVGIGIRGMAVMNRERPQSQIW